jgi:hypothetical protein
MSPEEILPMYSP